LTNLTGGIGILDFDRGYDKLRVMDVLNSYGPEGMSLYARIQILDLINPALYTILLAAILYILWQRRSMILVVIPALFAGGLDYSENFTLFLLVQSYPEIPELLILISSSLSIAKNIAMLIAVITLLIGMVIWTRARFSKTR